MTIDERQIMRAPNSDNAPPKRGKNYLLVIGIDKYQDTHVPPLKNAVRDTERLVKILTDKYEFQLFRALHNESATRIAVLDAIEELESRLTGDDNLVIFFSGHGYRKNNGGFIVPFDGRNDKTSDYISFADLNLRIDGLPMHHFLFILDCCYAGSALKNLGEKRELNKPSRRILAASSPDETAQDGFNGQNSPFTSALAEILEKNEVTVLPVKTLFSDLRNLMDVKDVRQVPVEGSWKMESNRDGEFIFLKKDVEADTWNALDILDKNALNAFVKKYPNSVFLSEATAFIQLIEQKEAKKREEAEVERKKEAEKQAFDRAKKSGTKENLSNFIFDYPLSIYRSEARQLLAEAEEEAAWKEAKRKNSLSGFLDFQEIYGQGKYGNKCQERINEFRKPVTQPVIELPKPSADIVSPKVETFIPVEEPKPPFTVPIQKVEMSNVVEKQIEKIVEEPVIQRSDIAVEPSFWVKYKMYLLGVGVLVVLIVLLMPKNEKVTIATTPSAATEVTDLFKATLFK
jgi:Caspase domain